jgi:hypothetical protein
MQITYAVRNAFFDRPAVAAAVDRAQRQVLSRAGAFIRTRARSSLRRRKGISEPGRPPSIHSKSKSLKTILFAYDLQSRSVVVGPVLFNAVTSGVTARTTVPALHEFGGDAVILEYRYVPDGSRMTPTGPNEWRRVDLRRKLRTRPGYRLETRKRIARYPARPFMGPALAAERPNIVTLFRDSVKGQVG